MARRSMERILEPDSLILTRNGHDSIQQPYNEMLEEAAAREDLEMLILMHQDLELLDDSLLERVRPLLADSGVGLVGIFGGRRPPALLFGEEDRRRGRSVTPMVDTHHSAGPHEVEVVDGVLLAIAPWVVRSVRFNESLAGDFHGYDIDFSLRVRSMGGRIICTDAPYFHHMERPWNDSDQVRRAGYTLAKMWDPALRPLEWAPAFRR